MREDDDRRSLKLLTEAIYRLLALGRMDFARKLQRKSLKSGAIDVDAAHESGVGTGCDNGKQRSKGKGKGQPCTPRFSNNGNTTPQGTPLNCPQQKMHASALSSHFIARLRKPLHGSGPAIANYRLSRGLRFNRRKAHAKKEPQPCLPAELPRPAAPGGASCPPWS